MTAYIHLRPDPHYRMDAFVEGCKRLGHDVVLGQPPAAMEPWDIGIIWNKTARSRKTVEACRAADAPLIVVENGYYGDEDGLQPFAMALDGHCGSGRWFVGDQSRLDALEIDFHPQRDRIPNCLIANQRGIGAPRMASPHDFIDRVRPTVLSAGYEPVVREHPGRHAPAVSLQAQLAAAGAVVVWSSNCATLALIAGIPTYYCAPHIITQGAAKRFTTFGARPVFPTDEERMTAFNQMAWGQAFLSEITSGEAIRRLVNVHTGAMPSCQEGMGL